MFEDRFSSVTIASLTVQCFSAFNTVAIHRSSAKSSLCSLKLVPSGLCFWYMVGDFAMREFDEKTRVASIQVMAFSAFVGFMFSFFAGLLFGWIATKTLMFEYATLIAVVMSLFTAVVVHWGSNVIVELRHQEYQNLQTWAARFMHDPDHFTSAPSYQFAPFEPSSEKLDTLKNEQRAETQLMLAVSELYQRWQEARSHQTGRLGDLLAQQQEIMVGDEEYVEKQLHQYITHYTAQTKQGLVGKLFLVEVNHADVSNCLRSCDVEYASWYAETVAMLASYSHRFEQSALFRFGDSGVLIALPKLTGGEQAVVADKVLSIVLDRLPHVKSSNLVHVGVQHLSDNQEAMQQIQFVKLAMFAAQEKRVSGWWSYDAEVLKSDILATNERWNTRLESIVSRFDVVMVAQPVFISRTLNINHYELQSNIRDSHGNLVHESIFLPVAFQQGMEPAMDKVVCRRSLELLEYEQKDSESYSIKLHAESLINAAFTEWFITQLKAKKKLAKRLMIELKHVELQRHEVALSEVLPELQSLGVKLIANEVGLVADDWQVLNTMNVAQLKIAANLIRDLDKNDYRRQQIAELHQFAKSINAKVVACGVSASAEWKSVQQLNIYSAEGSYFSQSISTLVGLQTA